YSWVGRADRFARCYEDRNIAGPSPRIVAIPVTMTSVTVATDTSSWSTPESRKRQALRRTVLRPTGYELLAAIEQFNQPGLECSCPAVRRMAYARSRERTLGGPADGDRPTAFAQLTKKPQPAGDLRAGRRAVRGRRAGVRRHDIP